jgi:uncharacterized protein
MTRMLVWRGLDAPRMEIAHADLDDATLVARGTQIGSAYELRYELGGGSLLLDVVGDRTLEVELGDADFFDLGYSPLFNSLPILAHELHLGGGVRDFTMVWIEVPSLAVRLSQQRYEPLDVGRVRYREGSFAADIEFDDEGFVTYYPGLAERIS